MTRTGKDIRNEFLDFFRQRGHQIVPSCSLLPADDPTLLFTNAGMNQFKDVFLGTRKPAHRRVANSQKCIRAGGKHNDLEDVGHDCYHHTFFEMLGNWSFGDYFKAEAIAWAWELLTGVWGLPKERLYATVFRGDPQDNLAADDEAAELWRKATDIDPSHILRGGKKDNFWEMGDTGPCGPCSEIHYDGTADSSGGKLINAADPRVVELWNLVFIQFNRDAAGTLSPLPAKHVDTGMGLERICRVIQGKASNYASDLFVPIIKEIEKFTSHRYGAASKLKDRFDVTSEKDIADVACRVVADHARCLAFAIADGVIPSNEGRGYVLRRILRRAARYGRQYLKIEGPFLTKLVPTIVELMGEAFGELRTRQKVVAETIAEEEKSFGKTLDRGIELFHRQVKKLQAAGQKLLPGDVAFDLYATYGFPVDLTQIMAGELGMTVDLAGYDSAMAHHRELSGSADKFKVTAIANLPATDDSAKYGRRPIRAKVLGWVEGDQFVQTGTLKVGDEAAAVLDKTNFYGEQGGQVGDAGDLVWPGGRFAVRDTALAGQCVLHAGVVEQGELHAGAEVTAEVDPSRFDTMRNHTATHLLNWALRKVLGEHIHQAGSVVDPDRLRFDFTHNQAVPAEQLAEVERLVNQRILADEPVVAKVMPLEQAKKIPGVRAVFGEKYPDPVRVIATGGEDPLAKAGDDLPSPAVAGFAKAGTAVEFCGGTHLERTSPVGLFKIVSEESIAKGVRRITALTGPAAVAHVQELDATVRAIGTVLRTSPAELPARVEAMQKELKELRKKPAKAGGEEFQVETTLDSPHGPVLIGRMDTADAAAMRQACDRHRKKGAAAVFVGGTDGGVAGKVTLIAMVADALVKGGKCGAAEWVKAVAPIVGGSGGGKPALAQAGGKDGAKLSEALAAAAEWIRGRLP
jgi:alanyl-tRNA synthetase